ncbi:PaaI family thioesterase [Alcaligenaceae bacterium]|nr:PaaI family thioesterase [Alcaligenaceae bacterium]
MTLNNAESLAINNPFLEWMGVELKQWSLGYAEMHLPVSDKIGNRTGRVHGGVICTLLDSVSGYCGLYAPAGEPAPRSLTLSLTTNFLDSSDGDVLIAKGYMERRGRSVYFSRAEVWMDGTLLLATAVGTFKYLRPK